MGGENFWDGEKNLFGRFQVGISKGSGNVGFEVVGVGLP